MYWPTAAPQANTAGLGPITRPIWKASRNNTIVSFSPLINGAYDFNLYIKGTLSGSHDCLLYTVNSNTFTFCFVYLSSCILINGKKSLKIPKGYECNWCMFFRNASSPLKYILLFTTDVHTFYFIFRRRYRFRQC